MKREQESIGWPNPSTTRLAADRDDGETVSQCSFEYTAVKNQGKPGNSRDASGTKMGISRRKALLSGGGMLAAATMLKKFDAAAAEGGGNATPNLTNAGREIGMITMKDGATIFFKDWGSKNAQPIVFHHGWPLSSDDWDAQMLYFVQNGYRVIAQRNHLWEIQQAVWSRSVGWGKELAEAMEQLEEELGIRPDLDLVGNLFRPPIPHESIPQAEDKYNVFRIRISGVVVRYVVEMDSIQLTVEGDLDQPSVDAVTSDLVGKISALENANFILKQI